MTEIRKNQDRSRYELLIDGEAVGYLTYVVGEQAIDLPHTVVRPEHGGNGYAAQLTEFALNDVREQGKKAIPTCPYIARYIEKHPKWEDLLE